MKSKNEKILEDLANMIKRSSKQNTNIKYKFNFKPNNDIKDKFISLVESSYKNNSITLEEKNRVLNILED